MKIKYVNDFGKDVAIGERWIDRAGNECFYRPNGTMSCRTVNEEPSMAIQSERDSCDVNLIYQKYVNSGKTMMTNMRTDPPRFGDFTTITDYHGAVLIAQKAEEAFMSLPAQLRARFSNDPGALIDFLDNPENRSEAIKLGLITAPQDSQIPQGDVVAPSKEGDLKSATSSSP